MRGGWENISLEHWIAPPVQAKITPSYHHSCIGNMIERDPISMNHIHAFQPRREEVHTRHKGGQDDTHRWFPHSYQKMERLMKHEKEGEEPDMPLLNSWQLKMLVEWFVLLIMNGIHSYRYHDDWLHVRWSYSIASRHQDCAMGRGGGGIPMIEERGHVQCLQECSIPHQAWWYDVEAYHLRKQEVR